MRNQNGLILWEGPSALDGSPIVVIATGLKRKSANGKIGPDTVQVSWFASVHGETPRRCPLARLRLSVT